MLLGAFANFKWRQQNPIAIMTGHVPEHIPVLYQEVLDLLEPRPGGRFIDGTVGAGGHAASLLLATAPDGKLLAFDRDAEAIAYASDRLKEFEDRVKFIQASFALIGELAPEYGFESVDGILLDLGLSSRQLAKSGRGFSFLQDSPLDMRFDRSEGPTAADLVNNLNQQELAEILWRYGEVRKSRRYARAIIRERPISQTRQLAELIERESGKRGRIHPATQVFQALRIAVNKELEALEEGLDVAPSLLMPNGRLAVISFHSLEDRLVKRFIRDRSRDCICPPAQPVCTCASSPTLRPVTRKVIRPSEAEIARNPRSRSARLRVAAKAGELI
jgi:16S rRNA (cytosine1402-N4)-methyltransferase